MKYIRELNGFFYLEGFDPDDIPDWVTQSETTDKIKAYFHLNRSTRKLFKEDLLPLIKSKEVYISDDVYRMIKNYTVPNFATHGVKNLPYQSPKGITLKPHQDTAVKIMLDNNKFGFFLGTGTGKTLIAITWILNTAINKPILIVTPKKVIGQYQKECEKYLPQEKLDLITVTNFESLHKHFQTKWEAIIIDESHRVKNYTSDVNFNLRALVKNSSTKYVYLFTGTPQDKSRHDILPQLAILDERYMPGKSNMYKRYFLLDEYYSPKREISEFKKELTYIIGEITWGMQTEDAINLTEENIYKVYCAINPTADRSIQLPNKSGTVALTSDIQQVNDGILTVSNGGGITGSGTFTANQSGNTNITISHADTSSQSSVSNSGRTVLQSVTLDTYGHITGLTSATLTDADTITRLRGTTSGIFTEGDITLIPGSNVSISQTGKNITISSTDTNTKYTAGTNMSLSGTTFSAVDTKYTAGNGLTLTGTTFNHTNSITAGNAGPSSNSELVFSGTFSVPYLVYDAQGHITGASTRTITLPANPNVNNYLTGVSDSENGTATFTRQDLPDLTWTSTHGHAIGEVSGLQSALDGKANLTGSEFTGNINTTSITNTHYAQNVLRFNTTSTPVQTVIYTKIK